MKVYIDGEFFNKEDAKVSVFDHGLLYGDGVFEGIRVYNGEIFKLEEHVSRLFNSAKGILLEHNLTKEKMMKICENTVRINNLENGYLRVVITRGKGDLGIDPVSCGKASVIVIPDEIKVFSKKLYETGIEIGISSYKRIPSECFDVRVKSLNYLNNVLAKMEARSNGYAEAIMFNVKGFVAECTGDNIFIVKSGVLYTPSIDNGALEGITRQYVIDLAEEINVPVVECNLTKYDLFNADECFLTGTAVEIMPVVKIAGNLINNGKVGPITKRVLGIFKKTVQESEKEIPV